MSLFEPALQPALDSNGNPIPGATWNFYQSGTLTSAAVYSNASLSVSLGATVTANSAGRFVQIFLNDAVQYRAILKDAGGATLTDIDPISASNSVSTAATVADLQAMATANGKFAYLEASGRAGTFVFSTANLSAKVTADTAQGIYIAPASAPTGASGAWVRQYSGPVNVKWFGAVADDTTNDSAAFVAAIAYLKSTRLVPAVSYGAGSAGLFAPAGKYYLGTTALDISHTMIFEGEGTGVGGAGGTVLRWAAGTDGIRVQAYNTSGATSTRTPDSDNAAGSGSTIRNLTLIGGYAGTEGEYHGVRLRSICTVEQVSVYRFQGDGFYSYATAGSGAPTEGNSNCSRLTNCFAQGNRRGFYFVGSDANASTIMGCNAIANRTWGFSDESFLGNNYIACHAAANGWDGALGSTPTGCTYLGNRYYVKRGQAVGASTNAPSGTTADNTWWAYTQAGGTYNGVVAWVSGTTFREGGSYNNSNANATSTFFGCYHESDQNPGQISSPAVIHGGNLALDGRAAGAGGLYLWGDTDGTQLGYKQGIGADYFLNLNNNGNSSGLRFRRWTNPTTVTTDGIIWTASGQLIYDHTSSHRFRLAGSEKMSLSTSGLLVTGSAIPIGYGTGAGGAVTQTTSRTTGVTINKATGKITLVSAAGSATFQSFTVTNSVVGADDAVQVSQATGTDLYEIHVTAVAAGSFRITYRTTGGTTTEQPVFNFAVIKGAGS